MDEETNFTGILYERNTFDLKFKKNLKAKKMEHIIVYNRK